MPHKPKKPCAFPGCKKLTHGRYCEEHRKQNAADYNRFHRDPDSAKRYGRAWKMIRRAYIFAHPLCELCDTQGRLVPAEEVHHKTALADGGTHDWSNLQALCKSCHSRIHMTGLNSK